MQLFDSIQRLVRPRPWTAGLLLAVTVTFAFQGSRGLWEPDEGRYSNGALTMIESGDWVVPRVFDRVYLDKPPLTYWSLALGFTVFGKDEWGPRVVHGLWLLGTALLAGLLARKLWGDPAGVLTLIGYCVTLTPGAGANILTPDTILAFFVTLGLFAYWHWLSAERSRARWGWAFLFGLAFGLGILAKGTAMLVFAAPIAVHLLVRRGPLGAMRASELWAAVVVALVIGGSWYWAVIDRLPEAGAYFFDNQVSGRLWEKHYVRNSEWWAPFRIYLPVLTFGALPVALFWPGWLRRTWRDRGRLPLRRRLMADPALLLFLWVALPLLVFSFASSRLELYVLPLFAPLVIATAAGVTAIPARRKAWVLSVVVAGLVLIGLKAASGQVTPYSDSRALAAAMRAQGIPADTLVIGVHDKRGSLSIYGYPKVRWTEIELDQPYFSPPPLFDQVMEDLAPRCHSGEIGDSIVFTGRLGRPVLADELAKAGLECQRLQSHAEPRVHLLRCDCAQVQ